MAISICGGSLDVSFTGMSLPHSFIGVENLAKMFRRNYNSSFSHADNCPEKRLCIASLLVLA
jgi:hypothetical protein